MVRFETIWKVDNYTRGVSSLPQKQKQQWTVREVLDWTKGYFSKAGVTQARLEAEILLAHILETDRMNLYLNPDRPLSREELGQFKPLIKKRYKGVPLQYITGKVSFMGLTLKVDKRALIPRPETEELTEEILTRYRENSNFSILDLGTGSGAIAISLAKFMVNPAITATDIDSQTLELAKENAARNDVEHKIRFLKTDWFSSLNSRYDLIVSNPPYIPSSELEELDSKIKDYEPPVALDGGEEGMEKIEHIIKHAPNYLTDGGVLMLEIGHDQGGEVKKIAESVPSYKNVEMLQDFSGKERIIKAEKSSEE